MKKLGNALPYVFICIVSIAIFFIPIASSDELWNYNFSRNISLGMLPYRDFSMIQTPLSAYAAALILLLFGRSLFCFRIAFCLAFAGICSLSYSICSKVQERLLSWVALLYTVAVAFLQTCYNYNYLTAMVVLLIIKLEMSQSKKRFLFCSIIGFLIGLTPLIKQSTGLMLMAGNLLLSMVFYLQKRETLSASIARVSFSFIPLAGYGSYLVLSGTLVEFYDYAVMGIGTFTHRHTPLDLFVERPEMGVVFIIIIGMLMLILAAAIKRRFILSKEQLSSLVFSIAYTIVVYPLCDGPHTLCLPIVYLPSLLIFFPWKKVKKSGAYFCMFFSALIAATAILAALPFEGEYRVSSLNHFEHLYIDGKLEDAIIEVDEYIMEKNSEGWHVRIAEDSAAAFKIPLDQYEKNWDMLLAGNLGSAGIADLLEEDVKTLYLVARREYDGLQEQKELVEYIRSNYVFIESVGWFDVYCKH